MQHWMGFNSKCSNLTRKRHGSWLERSKTFPWERSWQNYAWDETDDGDLCERGKVEWIDKSHFSAKRGWRELFLEQVLSQWHNDSTVAPKGECSKSQRCGKCSVDFPFFSWYGVWGWIPPACTAFVVPSVPPSTLDTENGPKIPSSHVSPWSKTESEERGAAAEYTSGYCEYCKETRDKGCNQSPISSDRGLSLQSLLTWWHHWSPWLKNQR